MTDENLDDNRDATTPGAFDSSPADGASPAHTASGTAAPATTDAATTDASASAGATSAAATGAPVVVDEEPPQYGVGPFTIREVALGGIWLVAFVVSFFPVYGQIGTGPSVWSSGIDWVLTIGVPTVAVFLLGLRRLSPQGIRRVGSLGIDQFASVAFSVSAVIWLGIIWNSFIMLADQRVFAATWVVWVEFFAILAGVFLTVFAPFIAPFEQDFQARPEVPAHRNARPVRAVTARPAAQPRPAPSGPDAAAPTAAASAPPAYGETAAEYPASDAPVAETSPVADPSAAAETTGVAQADPNTTADTTVIAAAAVADDSLEPAQARDTFEPVAGEEGRPRHQAFWALAPEERDVVDEVGIPVFRVGPTAWALVIEDRGDTFVVRHEDGRIGYLHDVTNVTRG